MQQSNRIPVRWWLTAALLSMVVVANACSQWPRGCRQASVVCVGLVTGYGGVRAGIEKQAWLALQDSRAGGTVQHVDFIETLDTRDRGPNIAYFVDAGYDIVVTTGAGILDEAVASANRHPDVLFVTIQPGNEELVIPTNVIRLEFPEARSGFLAGAAAAMVTQTKHVAAVCEAQYIDYVSSYCEGFAAGAKYVDDQVQAKVVYRRGPDELLFHDVEWGATTAEALIEDGADVIFAVGEGTAEAALVAASEQRALVIGAQVDQYDDLPEIRQVLITSAVINVRESLASLILAHLNRQLRDGSFRGEAGLAPFHDFDDQLPPGTASILSRIEADLENGRLVPNMQVQGP